MKAERWNGRHAMFGWFMILSTAVMQKYGLFPNPDVPLQYKDWGERAPSQKGGRVPTVHAPEPHPLAGRSLCAWRGARGAGVVAHGTGVREARVGAGSRARRLEPWAESTVS